MADQEQTTPEQAKAWLDAWKVAGERLAEERAERSSDSDRRGREFVRAIALQRRLVRLGVSSAPNDWEEHEAWIRVQTLWLAQRDPADQVRAPSCDE